MRPRVQYLRRRSALLPVIALLALILGGSNAASAPARPNIYQYAGDCWRLRDMRAGKYVGADFFGYALKSSASDATAFRLQATALGSYLLYGPDAKMPASFWADAIIPTGDPGPVADWRFSTSGEQLRLTNVASGRDLSVRWDGRVVQQDEADGRWRFEPAQGCAVFPELDTDIDATPAASSNPNAEVRGFLDAHVHPTAFEFIGGQFHCGRPWSPYGVTVALKDCPDAAFNQVIEQFIAHGSVGGSYSTEGWPDFDGWPRYDSLTHEGTYWKSIERSWRGGLRVMVADLVENSALCELYYVKQNPCTDMASMRLQAKDLYALQDYIDAQFKGPGKGFFRIVKSPGEARTVINQGKLAVVMGVETSQPFDCLYQRGVELCTRQQIDRGLRELWDLGVRSLFPIHKFDNAFGGTAMDDGVGAIPINVGNKWQTGRWWEVESCPTGEHDKSPASLSPTGSGLAASALTGTSQEGLYSNVVEAIFDGPLPYYPPGPICNVRGLTSLGEYLINRMIDMGMIIETDHMSVKARARALEIMESRHYAATITSHSWGDPTSTRRIQALGGAVAFHVNDPDYIDEWQTARLNQPAGTYFGIGFGTDTNGLATQAKARNGANPVTYPFFCFDGQTVISQSTWNTRSWDFKLDGAANYGLYPDWIEDLRHRAGQPIMDDLARGAEAYLRMWQRASGPHP